MKLNKNILYLPCRHHIFEVVLSGVFASLMPASTGPSILLFTRFQSAWPNIDKSNFEVGMSDPRIEVALRNHVEHIELFVNKQLTSQIQPRDDYFELLNLCLIFIGKVPCENVKFYKPGAVSRARWMARAIYCLKIFLFQVKFTLK